MSFDRQHIKITYLWHIFGEPEIAENGLQVCGGPTFDAEASLASIGAGSLASFGQTLITTLVNDPFRLAVYARLDSVKAAAVDTSGHYLGAPVEEAVTMLSLGSSGSVTPQTSICVSLWSGEVFGRANYGKTYIPYTKLDNDTGKAYASDAATAAAATAMDAYLTGLNGVVGGWAGSPSLHNLSRLGSGATKLVTKVRVGRVMDTQRRRRNKLTEAYSESDL